MQGQVSAPAEYIQGQGEQFSRHCLDTVLLHVISYFLYLAVQVEVVSVPDWSTDLDMILQVKTIITTAFKNLALYSPQVEGLPT